VSIFRLRLSAKSQADRGTNFAKRWTPFCLFLPIVVYGICACRTNLNIGIRHIFPVYPFIFLLMAMAAARMWRSSQKLARIALGILALSLAVETLSCWPDYIPFFNIACGGSRGGLGLLGDSNLDWGQDLPLLAQWQQQHQDTLLYLNYFGIADPRYYNIAYLNTSGGYGYSLQRPVPMTVPGVFAISATNLQGMYYTAETRAKHLEYWQKQKPIAVLGGSIYLYEFNPADLSAKSGPTSRP
jgi:hypothetical protein